MDSSPEKFTVLSIVAGILVWACLGVWSWVFLRKRDDLPVLPLVRRRPVPWRGVDIAVLVVSYVILSGSIIWIGQSGTSPEIAKTGKVVSDQPETASADKASTEETKGVAKKGVEWTGGNSEGKKDEPRTASSTELSSPEKRGHAITLVLHEASLGMIAFCFFMAVIFAPFVEEIVFRMFLQGYFEKLDTRFRLHRRRLARYEGRIESQNSFFKYLPWGVAPILIVSTVFAMMHFRMAAKTPPIESIRWQMTVHALSATIAVIFLLFWLRLVRGARLSDFGIVPREIPRDILRGLVAFFAIAAPVYACQIAAASVIPKDFAPDPIPLFVFSIVLGTVWCRTHRLIPSIVMHMSLNGTSMGMALYFIR